MALTIPVTWRDADEHRRLLADGANGAINGRTNAAASVTLTANAASTAVMDARVGSDSVIVFMPKTANAAAEVGAGTMYVSSRGKQTFTITHANNAQTDRDFEYSISGTGRGT